METNQEKFAIISRADATTPVRAHEHYSIAHGDLAKNIFLA